MPQLDTPMFTQSVVYIYSHNVKGAHGIVINKKLQATLDEILSHLSIEHRDPDLLMKPVMCGGPVELSQGLIIKSNRGDNDNNGYPIISSSKEQLEAIAEGGHPEDYFVCLGQASWGAGQLEQEIKDSSWLVMPYSDEIMFHSDRDTLWNTAMQHIGIDGCQVSGLCGHA